MYVGENKDKIYKYKADGVEISLKEEFMNTLVTFVNTAKEHNLMVPSYLMEAAARYREVIGEQERSMPVVSRERRDFKALFDKVENGAELSAELGYGFSDEDLSDLAILHRDEPEYRTKIYDLLEDCNFHTENADFDAGNYDKYIEEAKDLW